MKRGAFPVLDGRLTCVCLWVGLGGPGVFHTGSGRFGRGPVVFAFKGRRGGQIQYCRVRMVSRGSEKVRALDGRGASFLGYDRQVRLWMRTTRTGASARESVLILPMRPAPRQVCLGSGSGILGRSDGVAKILEILRNYCAPGAADSIRQQVMRYMRFRRTDQSVGGCIAGRDLPRRKAESKVEMGAGFPGQFVSILRMDDAALSRHEELLVMASCRECLKFEDVSANMRRLFGSRGGGSRQDALSAEVTAESLGSDEDLDILAAYRKANKQGAGKVEGPSAKGRGQGQRGLTNPEWI